MYTEEKSHKTWSESDEVLLKEKMFGSELDGLNRSERLQAILGLFQGRTYASLNTKVSIMSFELGLRFKTYTTLPEGYIYLPDTKDYMVRAELPVKNSVNMITGNDNVPSSFNKKYPQGYIKYKNTAGDTKTIPVVVIEKYVQDYLNRPSEKETDYCNPQGIILPKPGEPEEDKLITISVIDHNSPGLFVLTKINVKNILDEEGNICVYKIIEVFNKAFSVDLKESEISWGEVEQIQII